MKNSNIRKIILGIGICVAVCFIILYFFMRLNQDNKNYVSTLPEYYTNDITLLEVKDDIDKFLDFRDLQIEYGTPEYADFLSELTTEKYRNNLSEVTRRYYRAFASVYLANVDLGGIDLERTVDGRTI